MNKIIKLLTIFIYYYVCSKIKIIDMVDNIIPEKNKQRIENQIIDKYIKALINKIKADNDLANI